jgi:hypothetical protein
MESCDDDKLLCADIERMLIRFNKLTLRNVEVEVYYSGKEVLR